MGKKTVVEALLYLSNYINFYLKLELGSIDIHAGAKTLSHHHPHTPDTHHTAVQVALHAAQHTLKQL